VVQTLNTEVVQQVTIFKNAKGSRVLFSLVQARTGAQSGQKLGASEQEQDTFTSIFTKISFEFQMSIKSKVVCLEILHIFPFGWF
jgi:hypothetical protein